MLFDGIVHVDSLAEVSSDLFRLAIGNFAQ